VKLQFPAVIFDLDGTLIDSCEALVEQFADLVDIVQNGRIDG
jgi:beta-phosphoglucomutase-like phosphatase (HAD superfamily)